MPGVAEIERRLAVIAGANLPRLGIADTGDPASVRLHRRLGFTAAGRLEAVGSKHAFAEVGRVNLSTSGWDIHLPFGGFRESGSAFKEQGVDALRVYTRTKTVAVCHGA